MREYLPEFGTQGLPMDIMSGMEARKVQVLELSLINRPIKMGPGALVSRGIFLILAFMRQNLNHMKHLLNRKNFRQIPSVLK